MKEDIVENLDDLLKSYQSLVNTEMAVEPLLNEATYRSTAEAHNPLVGHIYVGCISKWLYEKGLLTGSRLAASIKANSAFIKDLSPAEFSTRVMDGKLFEQDVDDNAKDFARAYVRDSAAYGSDYFDVNVTEKQKKTMSDVDDSIGTYVETSERIDRRSKAYQLEQKDWAQVNTSYIQVALTDEEKTTKGWLEAFTRSQERDSLPEKLRREQLNKFWALVDYAPEIQTGEIVHALVKSFSRESDRSVMEAVTNSLHDMKFDTVVREVFSDAPRLEREHWLVSLLGLWGELNSDQAKEIVRQFENCSAPIKKSIRSAILAGMKDRNKWAFQLDDLL